jgi:protein-disulfide isomerase
MSRKTIIALLVSLVAVVLVYNTITWMSENSSKPLKPPPRPTSAQLWKKLMQVACKPARGNPKAQWTVIEIGDFQCPMCGKSRRYVETLIDTSDGKAKLYFVNYPLEQHAFARNAAAASLAAEKQGKFWEMYDALYAHQDNLNAKGILADAVQVGLDEKRFETDQANRDTVDRVTDQRMLGDAVGVQSTPSFLVHKDGTSDYRMYVGMWQQAETGNTPGLRQLMTNTPWGVKIPTAKLPPPTKDGAKWS